MGRFFRKGQVFTIPNLISLIRLLLIPVILWAFLKKQDRTLTIVLLAVSAVSDILDGQIARKFHMVSDLGKALDPIADKLTQLSMVICLSAVYPLMRLLLVLCVVRELCMGIFGLLVIRKNNAVHSANWYGKLSTVVLHGTVIVLLLFPNLPKQVCDGLIIACVICVTGSLTLYMRYFLSVLLPGQAPEETDSEHPGDSPHNTP